MKAAYRSRPVKRNRRTQAQVQSIRDDIVAVLQADHPMTVRQVFYQLVSRGTIAKTEKEYKGTVDRLGIMRRKGDIPFSWIADATRWMRKPRTFSSAEDALRRCAEAYRRALWYDQDVYVEVWLEKEALAGVLYDVTEQWDVPLMVCRGYPSISFLRAAADIINNIGKPAYLYYFGDHDPSGINIQECVERDLRDFAPDAEIHFERIAVTPDQIRYMRLPNRPTKKTDTRAKNFKGNSVEVDSIPSVALRSLLAVAIESHVDQRVLRITQRAEEDERRVLLALSDSLEANE
jgi:hypothetical protein